MNMKKRLHRLTALLLAMLMIFNMAPISVFAEGDNPDRMGDSQYGGEVSTQGDETSEESEEDGAGQTAPAVDENGSYATIEAGTIGTESAPQENLTFKVQYVVDGEYTYTGQALLLKTEEVTSATQVSAYHGDKPAGCEWDNQRGRAWSEADRLLTLYCKPLSCEVELRYCMIVELKDGRRVERTFQMLQNEEVGLEQGDQLEVKKFLVEQIGSESDYIKLKEYRGKTLNQLLPITVPGNYLVFNNTVNSKNGKAYELEFYGYNFGDEVGANLGAITTGTTQIPWKYDNGKINLYFSVGAVDSAKANYYTITWNDEDGTQLAQTTVKEGRTPFYTGTPTKASDDEYTYTFAGWTPEITPATSDTTYTAVYTAVPRTGGEQESQENREVDLKVILVPKPGTYYSQLQIHDFSYYHPVEEWKTIKYYADVTNQKPEVDLGEVTSNTRYSFKLVSNGYEFEHLSIQNGSFIGNVDAGLINAGGYTVEFTPDGEGPVTITAYEKGAEIPPDPIGKGGYVIHHYLYNTTTKVMEDVTGKAAAGTEPVRRSILNSLRSTRIRSCLSSRRSRRRRN